MFMNNHEEAIAVLRKHKNDGNFDLINSVLEIVSNNFMYEIICHLLVNKLINDIPTDIVFLTLFIEYLIIEERCDALSSLHEYGAKFDDIAPITFKFSLFAALNNKIKSLRCLLELDCSVTVMLSINKFTMQTLCNALDVSTNPWVPRMLKFLETQNDDVTLEPAYLTEIVQNDEIRIIIEEHRDKQCNSRNLSK